MSRWSGAGADGTAAASGRHQVAGHGASIQPDSVMGLGLRLLDSRARLRIDLIAQCDLAGELRHKLAFWKKPKHREQAGAR